MSRVNRSATRESIARTTASSARRLTGVEVGRIATAVYFLAMALGVNVLVTLRHPDLYDRMADLAVLPPYAWLLREVIRPLATPFTLLLITFEVGVAVLVLGRRTAVTVGLLAAIAFQLAVIPAVGIYGLVNLPVVAGQAWLLRHYVEPMRRRPGHRARP